jgi:hypothetical protein
MLRRVRMAIRLLVFGVGRKLRGEGVTLNWPNYRNHIANGMKANKISEVAVRIPSLTIFDQRTAIAVVFSPRSSKLISVWQAACESY